MPTEWLEYVNEKEKSTTVNIIRNSIERQAPYGDEIWQTKVANLYGLQSSLKPRGRPKKEP